MQIYFIFTFIYQKSGVETPFECVPRGPDGAWTAGLYEKEDPGVWKPKECLAGTHEEWGRGRIFIFIGYHFCALPLFAMLQTSQSVLASWEKKKNTVE